MSDIDKPTVHSSGLTAEAMVHLKTLHPLSSSHYDWSDPLD